MKKNLYQLIGLYELLTGGYCAMGAVYSILFAGGGSLAALISLGLCILTAVAGLWLYNNRPGGVRLSIASQAAQTLSFSLGSVSYLFSLGVALWVNLGRGGLRFRHAFGPDFSILSGSGGTSIGINLLPLAMLLYLWFAAPSRSGKR